MIESPIKFVHSYFISTMYIIYTWAGSVMGHTSYGLLTHISFTIFDMMLIQFTTADKINCLQSTEKT